MFIPISFAWVGLKLIDLSIRVRGVRRTYRFLCLTSPSPKRAPTVSPNGLARVGRIVRKANRRREAYCLRRALLIWWSLRWLGVSAEIYCDTGIDKGHAWVEAEGQVVGDRATLLGTGRFGRFSVLFDQSRSNRPVD